MPNNVYLYNQVQQENVKEKYTNSELGHSLRNDHVFYYTVSLIEN